MKRFTYSIFVLIISIFNTNAQNSTDAEKVINNLVSSLNSGAIKTNFTLSMSEKNGVNSQSGSGTFILKGKKFALEMDETKAWFDGKTQWTFVKQNNEVSVTEPSEEELATVNPIAIIEGYKTKSYVRFSKTKSSANYIVEMKPKFKNDDFVNIEIQVAKSTGNLNSIKMTDKKGHIIHLSLKNYQKGLKVTNETFVFNKAKLPGVMVNDLR
ncbi:MAG: outer membrane lipoprotein carrier protein LolA [Paludibacter sp.]|nr:outer membrane lipoprotein carrier protein LolA [Paludibacter sp.]